MKKFRLCSMLGSVGPPTSIGLRIPVVRAVGNETTTTTLNVVANLV